MAVGGLAVEQATTLEGRPFVTGVVVSSLTGHLINAYPYGFWMPEPWLGLWGVAGLGTGRAELADLGVTREGGLRMWLGAMGQRVELLSAGGLSLAAKS